MLPINLNGPIIFIMDATYKLEWACYYLLRVLPINMNGPIIFIMGATYKLKWAHYFL
jgi:hypothetical protein